MLTPRGAADLLRARDTLAVPLGPGQPPAFLHALGERDDFQDLQIFAALLMGLYRVFTRPGVSMRSGFFGPVERGLREQGFDVQFVPADFRRFARLLELLRPRVMATAVAPPDASGRYSLSLHAGATLEGLRACGRDPDRVLIAEVNPELPRTFGLPPEHPHSLSPDEIDVLVEAGTPPVALPEEEGGEVDRAIAEHVLAYVPDGATLQTGIGAVPSRIVSLLARGSGGDYGVHSEMFTTGLMQLHRAGKISNRRKGVFDGVSVCTFAAGSTELYAWLHENEAVRFLPVEVVNDPAIIARNRDMICINGALGIDLDGQVSADTLGPRQFSGIGGHEDFAAGPGLELSDRSIVCMPSTAGQGAQRVSRIVTGFEPGTCITTPRHQVDLVVTEYGAAELQGRTVRERAEALAAVAHPDFREELLEAASRKG
ncbi:MAG: acetyl-CoA hydrolase/transferase C-terminal domain-containing protein [Myxococcota bacterium]|nr:acetyl-CoA hydrolase/transferase C-terminal domain-containing protein [Myxococcota bacterium]